MRGEPGEGCGQQQEEKAGADRPWQGGFWYILKGELTGFADGLNVECERKTKLQKDTKTLARGLEPWSRPRGRCDRHRGRQGQDQEVVLDVLDVPGLRA